MLEHVWSWLGAKTGIPAEAKDYSLVRPAGSPAFEPLEPRVLLNADLAGAQPNLVCEPTFVDPAVYVDLDRRDAAAQEGSSPILTVDDGNGTSDVNEPPSKPTCGSPVDGATGISLTPTLESSNFSDPDAADTHTVTQCQVDDDSDFSSPVWDHSDTGSDKTSEAVPSGTLSYSATYYWRLRYQDSQGAWSEWSDARSFTVDRYSPVYRFWNASGNTHFYTISAGERDKLLNNYSDVYTYEGVVYSAYVKDQPPTGTLPVYRFWKASDNTHFYTIKEGEKQKLIDNYPDICTYEGPAFYAYAVGQQPVDTLPVYRFWKPQGDAHFYTITLGEKDKLINDYPHVYTYEGVAWYAYTSAQMMPYVLQVYWDGRTAAPDIVSATQEGAVQVPIQNANPLWPAYYVYVSREGYYTELQNCVATDYPSFPHIVVEVGLDPISPDSFNGTIFLTHVVFSSEYLADTDVTIKDAEDSVVTQFRTDAQGRFHVEASLSPGSYFFEFGSDGVPYREPVQIEGSYQDFFFPHWSPLFELLKPNVYIYPQETLSLDVNIVFPRGGEVTSSIPAYGDGWHVTVEPSGIIDGEHEYLFYESSQPDCGQYERGWVIARKGLDEFFRKNLALTGFQGKEIDDFVDYWVPRLTEYPYYAIYPQYNEQLERSVRLEFSVRPDSLIRLIYVVRGLDDDHLRLLEPIIPSFSRSGSVATEWGVALK